MSTAILVALALLRLGAPIDVALATPVAALLEGVDPVVLAGYVLSEHSGGGWSGSCSDRGACGPFALTRMWERRFDDDAPGDQRDEAFAAARITARVILYSMDRHESCPATHDWRAHLKCGPGNRHDCAGPVRAWLEAETATQEDNDEP